MVEKVLGVLGQKIFEQRYAYPGEKSYADRCKAVARHISSSESDEEKEKWYSKFYEILKSGDFVPGGRILFGAGRNRQNMLNCYCLDPSDNVESIGKLISDTYRISCGGGGIGFNFSKIRPKGDDIQNIKYSAPGSVSVMQMINEIGNHVRAGKNRRTALIAILNITHPDILEFLKVKLDLGQLNNFNISVGITNKFIEACENDDDWYFTFNNRKYYIYELCQRNISGEFKTINCIGLNEEDAIERANNHYKDHPDDIFTDVAQIKVKAKDIWNMLWDNAVESGDPGIYNIDKANSYTNVSYFEELLSTNPCGEIPLPKFGNCCLGNINLPNFVEDGDINWNNLAVVIRAAVRFLDNVLSINHFPISECKSTAQRSRRIGLGVMGLGHMLIKLGLRYGSEKCLEFLERLFSTIRNEAYKSSAYLSRDKGAFPAFEYKKYLNEEFAKSLPARIRFKIKEFGIRNAVILTIPPTGTTSMVHGVSSGIEPIFSAMYKRRYKENDVWKEVVVLDPLFKEYVDAGKDLDDFVGAYDIPVVDHLRVQATIQRYIDSAVSKTINLPSDATSKEISDFALKYLPYLKGLTVYRASSKENEPLEAIPLTSENLNKYIPKALKQAKVQDGASCSLTGGGCG